MSKKGMAFGYKNGIQRPYLSTLPLPSLVQQARFTKIDRFLVFGLLSLAILIRLYKLPHPDSVVFDETHFGGFARKYFHGEYFVDVHPPFAKLVFFVVASLFGWDGDFPFNEIGEQYEANVPYVAMRMCSGLAGVATVLVTYGILRNSGCNAVISFFGAALFCIENSFITISRLIMLDSMLIFAIATTVFAFKKFKLTTPFTRNWYRYLVLLGFSIGFSISTKWVGFFTMSMIGILTVVQLWYYLGDIEISDRVWWKHVGIRVIFLIIVPAIFYIGFFSIHFMLLPFVGDGIGQMSPDFQITLTNSQLINTTAQVSLGSTITIKHLQLGSYLHSHNTTYITGSQEQQVTNYIFSPDENNEWIIEGVHKTLEGALQKKFSPLLDGATVRLYHKKTGKYMRVNDVRPPMSEREYNNEVSCFGDRELLADINYQFRLKIMKDYTEPGSAQSNLMAGKSIFQLFHKGTRCTLLAHEIKLPKWGFEQNEVLCANEPTIPNTLWYIETNSHPIADNNPEYPTVDYRQYSLWEKLVEVQKVMWRLNKSLTESHTFSSSPDTWPFNTRGINFWGRDLSNVYFLGNHVIYRVSFIVVTYFIALRLFRILSNLNPYKFRQIEPAEAVFEENGLELVLGWMIHYFPSFFMERQLFVHHYLASLFFGILLVSQFCQYLIHKNRIIGYGLMTLILCGSVFCYYQFIPIIYGLDWTKQQCLDSQWLDTWDINCMNYRK